MFNFVLALSVACATVSGALGYGAASWRDVGFADESEVVEFGVHFEQKNFDAMEAVLMAVSDPESVYYGRYPSLEAINAITAPDEDTVSRVERSFTNFPSISCFRRPASLRCRGTVRDVTHRFSLPSFREFEHVETGDKVFKTDEDASVDEEGILLISGLTGFPVEHYGQFKLSEQVPNKADDPTVIPQTLVNQYKLSGVKGSSKVIVAAVEFQNYPAYSDSDLKTFIKKAAATSFKVSKHIGKFNQKDPQGESTLDVQYIGAVAVGCTNWYVTEAQWMLDFTENMLSKTTYPDIVSLSYGWSESAQCQPCKNGGSAAYVMATNMNFMKLGTNGKTILASSGDSGAHGRSDDNCKHATVRPTYPAASPYVTAVGATQLKNAKSSKNIAPICSSKHGPCAVSGTEIVASTATGALITSGGGFSNVAPMPAWAHAMQTAYQQISGSCPPDGDYNKSGRGYPDVAALGHQLYIELSGQVYSVDGTSCSSPIWAGVVSLLSSSKGKLGFLNPMLYKLPEAAFTDVTEGSNYCTEQTCDCKTGFKAEKGWDAVTGRGVPNYPEIVKAMDQFQAAREQKLSQA